MKDFIASLKRWEGSVPHMYLDTKGFITVGVGNLLATVSAAMDLSFMLGKEVAFSHEIHADYSRILRMTPGLSAGAYRNKSSVTLLEEDIDRLLRKRLDTEFLPGLAKLLPGFSRFPRSAQIALLDIAFNCGVNGLAKFKNLRASVAAGDWIAAGRSSRRAGARDERNAWTRRQFAAAAQPLVS